MVSALWKIMLIPLLALVPFAASEDSDPATTQMFLAQKVAPVFSNSIDLYTQIVVEIHKQMADNKDEFDDIDEKTQEKLKKTMIKLAEAAQKLCFFANKLKIMAQVDEKAADNSRSNDIQKVRDLGSKKIELISKVKDLETKLKSAIQTKEAQVVALEVKKQALKVAEKALRAAPCKKGRRKRSVNAMFCAARKPLKAAVKAKKADFDQQMVEIKGSEKNITLIKRKYEKMTSDLKTIRKKENGKMAKQRKQEVATAEAGNEVTKGRKLVGNMKKLEQLFSKVDQGLAEKLAKIDDQVPVILDAARQINVVFTSFKLPGGRRIPGAKIEKLEQFADAAEKAMALKQLEPKKRMSRGQRKSFQ